MSTEVGEMSTEGVKCQWRGGMSMEGVICQQRG